MRRCFSISSRTFEDILSDNRTLLKHRLTVLNTKPGISRAGGFMGGSTRSCLLISYFIFTVTNHFDTMQHLIPLQEAIDMTSRYQANVPAGMVNSEMFNKESVSALLNQPGCISLRIYYGKQKDDTVHAILVGVDENGSDMVQTPYLILEEGERCPPLCPTLPSPLNS